MAQSYRGFLSRCNIEAHHYPYILSRWNKLKFIGRSIPLDRLQSLRQSAINAVMMQEEERLKKLWEDTRL
jgi:hypothetical protein